MFKQAKSIYTQKLVVKYPVKMGTKGRVKKYSFRAPITCSHVGHFIGSAKSKLPMTRLNPTAPRLYRLAPVPDPANAVVAEWEIPKAMFEISKAFTA